MNVQVRPSTLEGAGRGLFALQDFAPGAIILSLDRPYVAELDTARLNDTCAWCFQRSASSTDDDQTLSNRSSISPQNPITVKACAGCHRVRYCSSKCQSRAWKREHKFECGVLKADASSRDLPNGVRAVVKLLGRLKADAEGKDAKLLSILDFPPSNDDGVVGEFMRLNRARFDDFKTMAYGAWKFAGEPNFTGNDGETVAKRFFFNVVSNVLSLTDPLDDVPLGIGFDPIVCSANHSCEPNACAIFSQPKMILRALEPIKAGSEIFIQYIDVTNPFSVRQAELKSSHFFSCRCGKCRRGAKFAEDSLLKSPSELDRDFVQVADHLIKRHQKQLAHFFVPANDPTAQRRAAALQAEAFAISGLAFEYKREKDEASEDEIRDALKLCRNSGLWAWTRQPVPHLLRQLALSYTSSGQIYRAWRVAAKLYFDCVVVLHSQKFYPDRVVDGWMLTTLTNALCNPSDAEGKEVLTEIMKSGLDLRFVFLGLLREVHEQIAHSYGSDSPFGLVVNSVHQHAMANVDLTPSVFDNMLKETWSKLEAVATHVDIFAL